ncbi:MAG: hypothetical protein ABIP56_06365 [Dokdonella sp.]
MVNEKILAAVGVADEDIARLCLLLQRVQPRLKDRWRWGVASGADLVIVDTSNVVGWTGWTSARASGIRRAVIASTASLEAEYALSRPLEAADIEFALNDVSRESAPPPGVQPCLYDFYYDELGCPAEARKREKPLPAAAGLDQYLSEHEDGEAAVVHAALALAVDPRAPSLAEHVVLPENPVAWRQEPVRQLRGGLTLVGSHDTKDEQIRHTLWAYLTGHLMTAPQRLEKVGLPNLVLDPVNRVFHSRLPLGQLQPYCSVSTALSEWQPVGAVELEQLRRDQPAQPYSKLLWLDALTHADGQLALHLDSMATYRLKHWLEIDDSMPTQQRIARTMVRARRLNEIAQISRASMTEVFEAISAFDAIGHVESTLLGERGIATPKNGERIPFLISRLRGLIEAHGRETIGLEKTRSISG